VLKWFLASLRGQQYAGRDPKDGVKKPLNAFLGEIFVGEIGDKGDETRLVSEQVSHHPPVTACYLWNAKHGVRAEGFTRQEITFTGSVNIQQIGHAILHVDAFDEDYLIPLPNIKVKGILTGGPYPELNGSYTIVSSSGFFAEADFTGKGMLGIGGQKNHVHAAVYGADDRKKSSPLFSVEGNWAESFTFKDAHGKTTDTYDVASAPSAECRTAPLEQQDPWESRKAWQGVISAIHAGNMQAVSDNKSALENAQRALRKESGTSEAAWKPLFFRRDSHDPVAEDLLKVAGQRLDADATGGIWRFDAHAASTLDRPWRSFTPHGQQ
jgi:hypothetical protein